uniref:RRM domain-containing protein n=1 Tax=Leersia perrieri TaxID=77586 RepID=A0A0D9WND3_9ORYZ
MAAAAAAAPSSTSGTSPGAATAAAAGARPTTTTTTPYRSRFGDTTLTKVFVGGLAWETPSEGLRRHFEQYGEILEAVVIADRVTGRSKGYGFVTFREPEAARRAVQEPNPMIAGRRANCNIASLGPPRPAQPPRGRASPGPGALFQAPPPALQGPPYIARGTPPPAQMMPQHGPAIYHPSQSWYWYPPDYQYQQALMNPQVLQNYYAAMQAQAQAQAAQLYGLASPTAQSPYHQYVGYMPAQAPTPSAVLPPAQQVTGPPFIQQPAQHIAGSPFVQHPSPAAAQFQGSFLPMPSLPQNFRLQLPPNAMSILSPTATALQPADLQAASSSTGATNSNNTPGA